MTILIVRPDPLCHELVWHLSQVGIKALAAPLLTFSKGQDLPFIANIFNQLPLNSIVIAVSPRAVEYTCSQMMSQQALWRKDFHYIAVGEKTADEWFRLGKIKANVPHIQTSEGILDMPAFSKISKPCVIILRGNTGRAFLGDVLTKNGANVHYVETYQRDWSHESLSFLSEQWQKENVDTLVVTSGEQLAYLYQEVAAKDKRWLINCNILVPSKRVYNQAIKLGFTVVNNVNSASNKVLFDVLNQMHKLG